MLNILLHGASVTQQEYETSYFWHLKELSLGEDFSLRKKGYGGCHLDDAGFLTIDSDSNIPTDIALLEWNTTSLSFFNMDKVEYMADLLLNKKIIPCFLILARKDSMPNMSSRKSEDQVIEFCKRKGIFCFDYRSLIEPDSDLRDMVHTNLLGAKKYAESIFKDLLSVRDNFPAYLFPSVVDLKFNITKFPLSELEVVEGEFCLIKLSNLKINSHVIIETVHGPESAIIDVNDGQRRLCIWDMWSHYERVGFVAVSYKFMNITNEKTGLLKLSVLSDKIDYSNCARAFDYEGVKNLKIKAIYGVNCDFIEHLISSF